MTDRKITLAEPEGSTLEVVLVTAGTRAGLPSATFEVDFDSWERIESSGLLHADPARSRSSARSFDPQKTVQIEAVLDPVAAIDGIDALGDRLLSGTSGDALRSTEAWWALSATQEVDLPGELRGTGTLHEGISYEHPIWLQDMGGSVGLEEAWQRAMELGERLEGDEPMFELVVSLFTQQEWPVDRPNPEATVMHATVASAAGEFELYVQTDEDRHLVTAFATLQHEVPEERIPLVHELAARLNAHSPLGSYEVGVDDGSLSFKSGIDVTNDAFSDALARNLISAVLIGGERANPLLAAVAAGSMTPAEAAAAFSG